MSFDLPSRQRRHFAWTDDPVTDDPLTDDPLTDDPLTDDPLTDDPGHSRRGAPWCAMRGWWRAA